MNELGPYESRIRELFPELKVESISINREGLLNDAVVVRVWEILRLTWAQSFITMVSRFWIGFIACIPKRRTT